MWAQRGELVQGPAGRGRPPFSAPKPPPEARAPRADQRPPPQRPRFGPGRRSPPGAWSRAPRWGRKRRHAAPHAAGARGNGGHGSPPTPGARNGRRPPPRPSGCQATKTGPSRGLRGATQRKPASASLHWKRPQPRPLSHPVRKSSRATQPGGSPAGLRAQSPSPPRRPGPIPPWLSSAPPPLPPPRPHGPLEAPLPFSSRTPPALSSGTQTGTVLAPHRSHRGAEEEAATQARRPARRSRGPGHGTTQPSSRRAAANGNRPRRPIHGGPASPRPALKRRGGRPDPVTFPEASIRVAPCRDWALGRWRKRGSNTRRATPRGRGEGEGPASRGQAGGRAAGAARGLAAAVVGRHGRGSPGLARFCRLRHLVPLQGRQPPGHAAPAGKEAAGQCYSAALCGSALPRNSSLSPHNQILVEQSCSRTLKERRRCFAQVDAFQVPGCTPMSVCWCFPCC